MYGAHTSILGARICLYGGPTQEANLIPVLREARPFWSTGMSGLAYGSLGYVQVLVFKAKNILHM